MASAEIAEAYVSIESARVLNVAATYHLVSGDYEEAKTKARRASELSRELGDSVGMAMAQSNLAIGYKYLDEFREAAAAAEEAVRLLRGSDETRRLIACLINAGAIWEDLGDFSRAQAKTAIATPPLDTRSHINDRAQGAKPYRPPVRSPAPIFILRGGDTAMAD